MKGTGPSALVRLIALVSCTFICGCSGADGLVGTWRTDMMQENPTGTNIQIEGYETAVFSKDGSFKITSFMKKPGGKETAFPFGGTYTMIDTNHVRLDLVPNSTRPDLKIPLAVSFTISKDQLEMDSITTGAIVQKRKYRRMKADSREGGL